jgi:hypothetical protein
MSASWSVPPEAPDRGVHQACGDAGDVAQSHLTGERAFVAEDELFSGQALRGLVGARGAFYEEPDLSESHVQEPGTEPVFPGAQDS